MPLTLGSLTISHSGPTGGLPPRSRRGCRRQAVPQRFVQMWWLRGQGKLRAALAAQPCPGSDTLRPWEMHGAQPLPPLLPAFLCPASPWRNSLLHILPDTGLLVAFGLGPPGNSYPGWHSQGAGRGPELSLPRHSPGVCQPASPVLPFLLGGGAGGREEGRAQAWPEALCCHWPSAQVCPWASDSARRPRVAWVAPPLQPEGMEGRWGSSSP